ncbi:MAG TPA: hypothetical protein PKJ98_11315 [Verrucomicrobiota bacterium]|nr:hypothetical protein [Verrucomicrobiota bacterium]
MAAPRVRAGHTPTPPVVNLWTAGCQYARIPLVIQGERLFRAGGACL